MLSEKNRTDITSVMRLFVCNLYDGVQGSSSRHTTSFKIFASLKNCIILSIVYVDTISVSTPSMCERMRGRKSAIGRVFCRNIIIAPKSIGAIISVYTEVVFNLVFQTQTGVFIY